MRFSNLLSASTEPTSIGFITRQNFIFLWLVEDYFRKFRNINNITEYDEGTENIYVQINQIC